MGKPRDVEDDTASRRDEIIKRMLATPPQPRKKPQAKAPAKAKVKSRGGPSSRAPKP